MLFWIGLIIGMIVGVFLGVLIMVILICCRLNDEDSHEVEVKKGVSQNGNDKEL